MRRKAILLATAMAAALVSSGGVATAEHGGFVCFANPCLGTKGEDAISGTGISETIKALAGDDTVDGRGGNDIIYGGAGNDGNFLAALEGAEDSDKVYGGAGNDVIDAAFNDGPLKSTDSPVDYSYGGRGNDTIYANDGYKDIIDCGSGREDTVIYDEGIDTIKNCEEKFPQSPAEPSAS